MGGAEGPEVVVEVGDDGGAEGALEGGADVYLRHFHSSTGHDFSKYVNAPDVDNRGGSAAIVVSIGGFS